MNSLKQIWVSFWRDARQCGVAGIALVALFVAVVLNRYRLDALPFRPQIEHIVLVMVGVVLVRLVVSKRARFALQWSDVLLAAYLAIALVASLLFPPDPRDSVQYWMRMVLAVTVYLMVRWLGTATPPGVFVRLALKTLLIFGVLEALFGIGSWLLYPFGINLGVDEYPLGIRGPGGVLCNFSLTMYGTLWEPNVFASTLMFVILIGAVLFVSNDFRAWRRPLGGALVIMLIAMGLNASRAAFLTLVFGLALIVLFAPGMVWFNKLKWAVAAVLVVVVVTLPSADVSRVLMQMPSAPGLAKRAPCAAWIAAGMPRPTRGGVTIDDPDTGPDSDLNGVNRLLEGQTLSSRMLSYRRAWGDFIQRPLLGNGANSFGQKYTNTAHIPDWISNFVLMSLHDTGIIGTTILLAWMVWFGWITLRALRVPSNGTPGKITSRTFLLALAIGLIALFVAYQVTTLLWFGWVWYLVAVTEMARTALKRA